MQTIRKTTAPRWVLTRALEHVKRFKAAEARWRAYVREHGWSDYCRHGRNIGSYWGADILCGACEDGSSAYDLALSRAWQEWHEEREKVRADILARIISHADLLVTDDLAALTNALLERFPITRF